jgi:hypothetical protein
LDANEKAGGLASTDVTPEGFVGYAPSTAQSEIDR